MVTTQLLVSNNKYLEKTLESIVSLGQIIVVDLVDSNLTEKLASKYRAKYFRTEAYSRSKIRNHIVNESSTEWQFYIEPWEILTDSSPILEAIRTCTPTAYYLQVLKGDILTREIRLWHKEYAKFVNPVYEHLDCSTDNSLDVAMFSHQTYEDHSDCLVSWLKQEPFNNKILYYTAWNALSKGDYNKFIDLSSHYLMVEQKSTISYVLTKYHRAIVNTHIKKDGNAALQDILECITIRPLMSEYWCLLGDIFYYLMFDYNKAQQFYDNAIILGKHRREDHWPLEISKYDDYPNKMITSCQKIRQETKWIRV